MKRRIAILAFVLFLANSAGAQQAGDRLSRLNSEEQKVAPFGVFDNLYYVGVEWVGAWVLATGDGLVLFDALYGPFVDHLLEGMEKMGLDPKEIKYILVTHGHFDHVGGANRLQELTGARVVMTEADWKMMEGGPRTGRVGYEAIARDVVARDGDTITLGEATLKLYVTPGHTPGVLSTEFTVYDRGKPHKAFMFGGVGLNFSGVERTEMYIESVKRLQAMEGLEVNIPNHASMGRVFERAEKLKTRRAGDPHPFVAPEDFSEWLDELLANAQSKLEDEKSRAGR